MTEAYEEILEGEKCLRPPPAPRHEEICRRLHERVGQAIASVTVAKLLPPRSVVEISRDIHVRPDLAILTAATGKLWLVAEVISSEDHNPDTVIKKGIYEQHRIPRLWMVDPRYNNVEVYQGSEYGISLKEILALRDILTEHLLPSFQYPIAELFKL